MLQIKNLRPRQVKKSGGSRTKTWTQTDAPSPFNASQVSLRVEAHGSHCSAVPSVPCLWGWRGRGMSRENLYEKIWPLPLSTTIFFQLIKQSRLDCVEAILGSSFYKGSLLQYSCLENPMDRGAWGRKELDTTEQLHFSAEPVYTKRGPLHCLRKHIPVAEEGQFHKPPGQD